MGVTRGVEGVGVRVIVGISAGPEADVSTASGCVADGKAAGALGSACPASIGRLQASIRPEITMTVKKRLIFIYSPP
jgi:hypothetical protein